ncbi:hypothetical protein [Spiroplasma endosymbiont of Glossina fuscipes fuscipes]|uniref:hypothetical protein n=1 Tax=Spiroplasma endosymbiont of Glossina fuscipes fuscipes TaxID=2004463 RepID=UPI003C72BADF
MRILINYNNQISWIKLGKLYQFMMYYLIPLILVIISFSVYDFVISCTINVWYISVLAFVLGILVSILVAGFNSYYAKKKIKEEIKLC